MVTMDLTPTALEGFNAKPEAPCAYYTSSPNGLAWLAGRWMKATGRTAPRDARPDRGSRIRTNDMLLLVDSTTGTVTREQ